MAMVLYDLARKVNSRIKLYKRAQAGKVLSPVRRIERVCPPESGRFVAMTFDDGPCAYSFSGSSTGLTRSLLDSLKAAGARASFDVIGTTAENYPDEEGRPGDFTWSGVHYDHYPKFGSDQLAGALNQPELVRAILDEGHELTNHSCTHRLFGPMRAVYGTRHHFETLDQVTDDLARLHNYIKDNFGYEMKLSRPPHYIDAIPGGGSSYDAYRALGYNYMAASFDGDGWKPQETAERELDNMLRPLRQTLERDPDALNGQIIFQKDGCNMALRSPVEEALPQQLKLLADYGYQVIPVSELLELSPFEDLPEHSPAMPFVKKLLAAGHTVGYKNNTFHGERPITKAEFYLMAAEPQHLRQRRPMNFGALAAEAEQSLDFAIADTTGNTLLDLAMKKGISVDEAGFKDKKQVRRDAAVELLAGLVK
jgi:peptidoglycan/xylan/chitin deacetylase (PgdA/CDA1 family)